ncbi:hypothetical protein Dimus_027193 [Dionaea muscipula]
MGARRWQQRAEDEDIAKLPLSLDKLNGSGNPCMIKLPGWASSMHGRTHMAEHKEEDDKQLEGRAPHADGRASISTPGIFHGRASTSVEHNSQARAPTIANAELPAWSGFMGGRAHAWPSSGMAELMHGRAHIPGGRPSSSLRMHHHHHKRIPPSSRVAFKHGRLGEEPISATTKLRLGYLQPSR